MTGGDAGERALEKANYSEGDLARQCGNEFERGKNAEASRK